MVCWVVRYTKIKIYDIKTIIIMYIKILHIERQQDTLLANIM